MKTREIRWADGTPSGSVELIPRGEPDHRLMARLERLRLVDVGLDGIRAARAETLEERVRAILPHEHEQGPLSPAEGLVLLELGPGMRLSGLPPKRQLALVRGLKSARRRRARL